MRDFEEGGGEGVECAGAFYDGVVGGEGFEFVGGGAEGEGGFLGDFRGDAFGEAGVGVEAGADCCAALGEEEEVRQCGLDARDAARELGDVRGELLAEGQGGGVLEVGAPDFDDVFELLRFFRKGGV